MQARARSLQYYYDHRHMLNKTKLCMCGGQYSMKNASAHFKCKLHLKYIQEWQNIDNDYNHKEVQYLETDFNQKFIFIMKFLHTTNYFSKRYKITKSHCTRV